MLRNILFFWSKTLNCNSLLTYTFVNPHHHLYIEEKSFPCNVTPRGSVLTWTPVHKPEGR